MAKHLLILVAVIAAITAAASVAARAGGILHVFPPQVEGETFAVARPTVLLSKTLVTVSEGATEFRFNQTFFNNNEYPVQGLFLMPLGPEPPRAEPDVNIDGITTPSRVFSPKDFFPLLKELTIRMHDPSLLGLAGQYVLVVRPVNMGVKQQRSFKVKYELRWASSRDELELAVALAGERYALGPVGELELRVRFKAARPIRSLFSPTHHLSMFRESPHRSQILVRSQGTRVLRDFLLVAFFSGDNLDVRVLTHREPGEPGAFLAAIAPPLAPSGASGPDKDVVFLLDCSGSMGTENLRVARSAVKFCLERLGPDDRFNIVTVGTRAEKMAPSLVQATSKNILDAVNHLNAIGDCGGTDLYNGIITALEQFQTRKRPSIVVVVGDGQSTVGITDPDRIVTDLRRNNRVDARFFVLAVGAHPDVALLDRIATATKGRSTQFSQHHDVESFMNRFFAGVSPPRVSGISLRFDIVKPEYVSPDPIPDLFGDDSVLVLGRYATKGNVNARVRLRGALQGKTQTVARFFQFPLSDPHHSYIPQLWAMRRLATLLETEWLKGADEAVRREAKELTERYGFRTPPRVEKFRRQGDSAGMPRDLGSLLWTLKKSVVPADVQSDAFRHVDGKVFRREETRWVDTRYRGDMPTTRVEFFGDEYFKLLEQTPELGPFLAIGPEVTIVDKERAVATMIRDR
ncbi:MAG: VWA domain-containing protein [Desulfomonile sp.]|nr:VWA domain-containing protein [Desulfomonile sp.]